MRLAQTRRLVATGLLIGACLISATCGGGSGKKPAASPPTVGGTPPTAPTVFPGRPNIVFVLTDDLSTDLVRYMPHVLAMERQGVTFTNYLVSD